LNKIGCSVIEASPAVHGRVTRATPCPSMQIAPTALPAAVPLRRTLWISDIHPHAGCQAPALLDFLKATEARRCTVGDIIDGWQLRRGWYDPRRTTTWCRNCRARRGAPARLPGNHDEFARKYLGHSFGGVEVVEDCVHTTADGRRLWVTHGDLFDGVIQCARWLAHVGDSLYEFTLKLNRYLNHLRAKFGLPYWSLSRYLKLKVKRAVSYVSDFEAAVAREASKRGVHGVVCGHIHHAELREIHGVLYANDGDWVESLSALAEHADGRLELIDWSRCALAMPLAVPDADEAPDPQPEPWPEPVARRPGAEAPRMKIALVTDAWQPQVNGVVTTLVERVRGLAEAGHDLLVVEPGPFRRLACPGYREIELAWRPGQEVARQLDAFGPEAVHIATEGPLGQAARRHCLARGWRFTTAFHTRFPDILARALHLPRRGATPGSGASTRHRPA
jgi:UDP-2,3-diacylglucosamine pyrophosphatase LpxH